MVVFSKASGPAVGMWGFGYREVFPLGYSGWEGQLTTYSKLSPRL